MNIADNAVVTMEYELTDRQGTVIDTTKDGELFSYIHGLGMILGGLENALDGKEAGDQMTLSLCPEEAYGQVNKELIQAIPIEQFSDIEKLEVGMQLQVDSDELSHIVTVSELTDKEVTIDANHPLAGVDLNFVIKIVDVRQATDSEIASGIVE